MPVSVDATVEPLIDALRASEPAAAADPTAIRVVRAPGRVNLIGDHTDYNDGFVLPAAIDLGIGIAFVPTNDRRVELARAGTSERISLDLDALGPPQGGWRDYVAGVALQLEAAGAPLGGLRGLLGS